MSDAPICAALPTTWARVSLGSLTSRPQYGWTSAAASSGRVRLLRTTDVTRGPIDWDAVPFCRDEPDELAKFQVHPGDIVVSRAGSVGVSALIEDVPCKAVFASYLIRLRCFETIRPKYLMYFLQSPSYWLQIEAMSAGITLKNINASKLKELMVPLCSVGEQERIVEILEEQLSRLDAAVKSVQTVREKAAQFRRSLLHVAFAGALVRDDLEQSSVGPKVHAVGDLASIVYGYTESASRKDVGPKFLRITDIQDGKVDWIDVPYCYIDAESEAKHILRSGDIVFARTGATTGKSFLLRNPPRAVCASYLIRLRPDDSKVRPEYLQFFFQSDSYWNQVRSATTGTAQGGVNASKLSRMQVPLFPFKTQDKIVEVLEEKLSRLDATLAVAGEVERRANALRRSLLHAAFTGELTRSWREAHV